MHDSIRGQTVASALSDSFEYWPRYLHDRRSVKVIQHYLADPSVAEADLVKEQQQTARALHRCYNRGRDHRGRDHRGRDHRGRVDRGRVNRERVVIEGTTMEVWV